MTDTTNTPAPTLEISQALSGLLLWLLDDNAVDLAKEVITKPWHFEDLAAIHAADPERSVEDAFAALDAQRDNA